MLTGDFQEKVWIFKQTSDAGHVYYSVMAPMPDDYKYAPPTQRNKAEQSA